MEELELEGFSSPRPLLLALRHPSANPQSLHRRLLADADGNSLKLLLLIVVPASALAFVAAVAAIFLFRRCARRKLLAAAAADGNRGACFREGSEKQHSDRTDDSGLAAAASATAAASYSPMDARSVGCMYGGKLGFSLTPAIRGAAQVFTYRELELATDGFSDCNLIGRGSFGIVFRGRLANGTLAAIKRLHPSREQGEREFRVEVDLLSRMHTRYLVGLLGYCADRNHRILVFEFMSNGSLKEHLHPNSDGYKHQSLDWQTRLKIALDCARAFEFLHERTVPAVIHRNFKCSNIFLDHNYHAKVSGFGMAKIGSLKVNGQVLTRVIGTTGYLAPEYVSTGKLTTKSDVYSYGVVLLELLTGRVPVDTRRPTGEHVLVSWALPRLTDREKVVEMVDPSLKGQVQTKELIQVAAIATMCVQPEADYRPLMTDIVQSLVPLVKGIGSCPSTPGRTCNQISVPSI